MNPPNLLQPLALTTPSANYRPDPDDDILKPEPKYPWEMPIITDERVPLGEISLYGPDSCVHKIINLRRECDRELWIETTAGTWRESHRVECELGLGHPGEHLVKAPHGLPGYLIVDDAGHILRRI
jgi:hypothetical protein